MKLQGSQKIILSILLSFFAILIIFALFIRCNHNKNKADIPSGSSNAQRLQNEIDEYYEIKKESGTETNTKTSTTKGIYFVLITTYKESSLGDYNIPVFKAYYYGKKDDMQLARSEIIRAFGYSEEYIDEKIKAYFKKLYDQEVAEEYVDKNECDFESCYLSFYRNLNQLDRYSLYAENNNLYVYISFDPDSPIGDKEFFDKLDYDYYKIEIN